MRKPRFSLGIHASSFRALAVALLCVLSGCEDVYVITATVVDPVFDATAIVRNAAGVEVAVTSAGDGLFAGEMFLLMAQGSGGTLEDRVRTRYKRAVNRRLSAGGDALVAARFGAGPWCFVAEPTILPTFENRPSPPDETAAELSLCEGPPPPPQCAATGDMPELSVDPPAHTFPDTPLGSASDWFPFTVSNSGTGFVCLASMIAGGLHAQDFQVDDSNCRPSDPEAARRLLGVGGLPSCTVRVRFVPTRPGTREGALRVSSNDPQVLQQFGLTGTGIAGVLTPTTPVCVPRVGDRFQRTVVLTNAGPGTVTVRSISVGEWHTSPSCTPDVPTSIPSGGTLSCEVNSPTGDDPGEGALVIGSDGVRDDPTATVIEIPLIPRVAPGTCTP